MSNSEIIVSSPSSQPYSVLHQSQNKPLRVKTQAGMKLELVIDGSRQTGKASSDPDHKRLYLKRAGVDLVVVSETDETLAVFEDYFVSPGAVLFGQEWTFVSASPPTGLTISELGLVSTGESAASALTVEPAIHIGEGSAAMAVAVPAALVGRYTLRVRKDQADGPPASTSGTMYTLLRVLKEAP